VLDAIQFEKRGIPAVAIITEPFVPTARALLELSGMSDHRFVVMPHPFGSVDLAEVRRRADKAMDEIESLLLAPER
jgi:hypothetical protein